MSEPPLVPDCRTPDEVTAFLRQLRTWSGGMSFRDLTLRVNAIRVARNARQTAPSTVNDCFQQGRARLDRDLVLDIAQALGLDKARLIRLEQVCQVADGRRPISTLADVADTIPAGRKEFTGRDLLLGEALAAITTARSRGRPPVVVFTGPAGIGKTELAVQLAHRITGTQRRFFVDLHGFQEVIAPSTSAEVLATLLKMLGVRDPSIVALADLERRALLRDQLADQRTVMVLDDVTDAEQLRQIVPDTAQCTVIATSQERIAPDESLSVLAAGPLDDQSSKDLLSSFDRAGRVEREPGIAEWLVKDLCGGRPFDLVALGGQLSDPEEVSWSLADHADRLARLPRDETSHQILTGSCHRLSPETRRLFRLTGLCPGFEFTTFDLAVMADLPVEVADAGLRRLYDRHLLLSRKPHRYQLHDTVAAYSRRLLYREESATSRKAALRRLYTATTRNVGDIPALGDFQ